MAREKDTTKKLKRLYDQLERFNDQPLSQQSSKIEQKILTLENTK